MKYKRLSLEEREQIHALVNQGKTNREIAKTSNRSHTTISRELTRCRTKFEYSPSKAHKHARGIDPFRGKKRIVEIRPEILINVYKELEKKHSPEQISQKMKKEHADEPLKWISHESIYKYIYALRGQIKDATPISERPQKVDKKESSRSLGGRSNYWKKS